ncbi:AAA family ATPase [Saccharomycopsis crataegensis]|uniref:Cell division control protein n=1 Tax=Saccharomycopsis crataegensis TaxID=43959 RepID=A0AAV5QTZ3_9ASCO|nr:AAA family ATPase [Saccharomycopsis crataegensis]
MGLKRKSSSLSVQPAKRQNSNIASGLLSPPQTPSVSRLAGKAVMMSSSLSTMEATPSSFGLLTPSYEEHTITEDVEDKATIGEMEYAIQNKENIHPELFSEKELQLIKEVEAFDDRHNIKTPETNSLKDSVYTKAKKLFSKCVDITTTSSQKTNFCLIGREKEYSAIESFLIKNIQNNASDFLYISGPPGCGKTQQVSYILDRLVSTGTGEPGRSYFEISFDDKEVKKITVTKINCMRLSNLNEIFEEFLKNFGINAKKIGTYPKYLELEHELSAKELFTLLISEEEFSDNNVIILDELDAVLNNSKSNADKQLVFDFFLLAKPKKDADTRLVLVGIANALNLIDKIAPRLKHNGLKTSMVQFLPYTTDKIVDIVKQKLLSLCENEKQLKQLKNPNDFPIINFSALQLCAKKTASNTGDLRKVFDILYRSIEAVETNTRKQYLSNPEKQLHEFYCLTPTDAPKVSISHIAKICSTSLNGISCVSRLKTINLYQSVILICLAKIEQQKNEQLLVQKHKSILQDSNTNSPQLLGSSSIKTLPAATMRRPSALRASSSIKTTINITELFTFYKKTARKDKNIPSTLTKPEVTEILSTLNTIGLVNVLNKGSHTNINSQTVISCCGVGLGDLNKFTDSKFEILKSLLKV